MTSCCYIHCCTLKTRWQRRRGMATSLVPEMLILMCRNFGLGWGTLKHAVTHLQSEVLHFKTFCLSCNEMFMYRLKKALDEHLRGLLSVDSTPETEGLITRPYPKGAYHWRQALGVGGPLTMVSAACSGFSLMTLTHEISPVLCF